MFSHAPLVDQNLRREIPGWIHQALMRLPNRRRTHGMRSAHERESGSFATGREAVWKVSETVKDRCNRLHRTLGRERHFFSMDRQNKVIQSVRISDTNQLSLCNLGYG
jgi:hypothetical protein